MSDQNEVLSALSSRLASLVYPGLTMVFHGKALSPLPALPILLVEVVPTSVTDATLSGSSEVEEGFAMFHAVTVGEDYGRESTILSQLVKALFPFGTRWTWGSTHMLVTRPPLTLQGYEDGLGWRVPTRVNYQAT